MTHAREPEGVLRALESGPGGLTEAEAERRLGELGPNRIREADGTPAWRLFLDQFRDFLIYLLLFAAALSVAVGFLPGSEPNYADAVLIVLILLGNGVFGFVQDYRAEKAMAALRELSAPEATVVRAGRTRVVDAREVVVGDVVVVEEGDVIPADLRLTDVAGLETLEAALTGESAGVRKGTEPVARDTPLAERTCMAYTGTSAVRGRGRGVVVATGMDTEVGSIASEIRGPPRRRRRSRRRSTAWGSGSDTPSWRSSSSWRWCSSSSPRRSSSPCSWWR